MRPWLRWLPVLVFVLAAESPRTAAAQWGYPGGFGMCGWGGWGVDTPEGSLATGHGELMPRAPGFTTRQRRSPTRSMPTQSCDLTSTCTSRTRKPTRRYRARVEGQSARTNAELDKIQARLRNTPEPRDIFTGDALNVAVDEIDDPRVYLAEALPGLEGEDRRRHHPEHPVPVRPGRDHGQHRTG